MVAAWSVDRLGRSLIDLRPARMTNRGSPGLVGGADHAGALTDFVLTLNSLDEFISRLIQIFDEFVGTIVGFLDFVFACESRISAASCPMTIPRIGAGSPLSAWRWRVKLKTRNYAVPFWTLRRNG